MRAVWAGWAIEVTAVMVSCLWPLPVGAASKAEQAQVAAKLVEETLRREAKEGVENRAELLQPAIAQTPECEAAWWQSGFLYDSKRKEWLRWDEVQQLAAKDDRLTAYRKIREKYPETEEGQAELARWCAKRKLKDQLRAHLTRVLEFNPANAEARQELGFRLVGGTWVDDRDNDKAETFVRETSAAAERWVPRLQKLRERLADDNASQQEQAREELMALRDPGVVGAVDAVFCRQTVETALLGIELLKNIQTPQAAAVLAWHAVCSPWPQVGRAAALALRSQEKHDYVPLLLDASQSPISSRPQVAGSSDVPKVRMLYRLDHDVSTYSWSTSEHLKEHPYWQQIPQMRFNPKSPDPVATTTTKTVKQGGEQRTTQTREYYTVRNNQLQERRTENKVTVQKQILTPIGAYAYPVNPQAAHYPQQTNASRYDGADAVTANTLCSVLAAATGEKGPKSPSEWRDWWYGCNEIFPPSGKIPKLGSETPASGETQSQWGDCLAADTLVRTETGTTAADKIAAGDRVFCCDPETGCLTLKPVLRKTVRPEGRLLKIRVGGEEFESSGGHLFWVAGRGWVKARDLREGMQLHTIRGTASIEGTETGSLQATFGLVVADLHTYFVGKENILTHDNTIRKPTNCVVPGLAGHVAASSP